MRSKLLNTDVMTPVSRETMEPFDTSFKSKNKEYVILGISGL